MSADGSFNCFGFGATLPNKQVSHCFPLTFADPRVMGVEGKWQSPIGTDSLDRGEGEVNPSVCGSRQHG